MARATDTNSRINNTYMEDFSRSIASVCWKCLAKSKAVLKKENKVHSLKILIFFIALLHNFYFSEWKRHSSVSYHPLDAFMLMSAPMLRSCCICVRNPRPEATIRAVAPVSLCVKSTKTQKPQGVIWRQYQTKDYCSDKSTNVYGWKTCSWWDMW